MNGLITITTPPHEDELYHYGTKRHSGRYPWGSGERPFQGDPQKAAARREKLREFGQKAKKVGKVGVKVAAGAALAAGVTALSPVAVNAAAIAGRNFLVNNPGLTYTLFSTKIGESLYKKKYGDTWGTSMFYKAWNSKLAAEAGQPYLDDYMRKFGTTKIYDLQSTSKLPF